MGWKVLGFGLSAALLACLTASVIPAIRAARLNPVDALRLGGARASSGSVQSRVLASIVTGQTALTLALLIGAGLLIRTTYNLDIVRPGYETRNLLTMNVTAVNAEYQDFHKLALERVTALPGVEAAAFAWGVPLTGNEWPSRIEIEGYVVPDGSDPTVSLSIRSVTSGYFDMLNQPVVVGRDFRPNDGPDTPLVAVVNEAFVERYLGGGTAVGRNIWTRSSDEPPSEIIGVIGNSRTSDLTEAPEPEVYLSLWQATADSKHLVIRSLLPLATLADSVRSALREIAPAVAIENIKTLDAIRSESLASRTLAMRLLTGFAALACVLTLGGVYSVLSLSVASRRREMAIRSAVGAERGRILTLVLSQGLRLIVFGACAGVLVSLALSRLLQSWLYGVDAIDPLTLLAASASFVFIASIACWAPARLASNIEPVEALKSD